MISSERRTRGDRQDDACLSDLRLDRLRVGELSIEARDESLAHIETCARCQERQRSLAEQAEEALAELPPLAGRAPLTERHPQAIDPAPSSGHPGSRRRWMGVGAAGLGLAAAALLLIMIQVDDGEGVSPPSSATSGAPTTTRTKGAPTLHFHIRRGARVFAGGPGELIRPGDALRFAYSWPEGGTIAVLSRDGAGSVSTYFPPGDHTYVAAPGEAIDLPGATLLDDVVGEEVLYGIFCAETMPLSALEGAIAARPEAPSIAGCLIDRIRVDKRAVP